MEKINTTALEKAIAFFGSQAELAKALNRSRSHVNQWMTANKPVSIKVCPMIEKLTNGQVRAEDLRPDFDWAALRGEKHIKASV
jgi:DNA-binding transcriptional regulator YdaS (Cro superfamily)